jgi:primosomal protein N' (replication factor Y)
MPAELEEKIRPGVRVCIPFKNREMVGYIVGESRVPAGPRLKAVQAVLDDEPVLSDSLLQLTRRIGEYYGSSWGEAIENALPKWVKYGKKAERMLRKTAPPAAPMRPDEVPEDWTLTCDQKRGFAAIEKRLSDDHPRPLLLYGVTGSGKSEIYIRAIRKVLAAGKAAICLVPEIALTEQLRFFFLKHFGDQLEILHSRLSDGERFLAWKRLQGGGRRVVLGPRSAVFAPVSPLGIIIMDEEHEGTYKQETAPRYHAREVAFWRARREGALFLMGTATPSLETMRQCETGGVELLRLESRIDGRPMPAVQVLDLKKIMSDLRRQVILTPKLLEEIEANLKRREGTLLLLNRRGFSTRIQCPKCGHTAECKSCQVSLTYHQESDRLLCHYCNFQKKPDEICSECGTPVLRFSGFGTEKIESEIAKKFPAAKIARLDADTVKKKGSHEIILRDFRDRKADILIGTQMIAKGFDFPHVTLVGVVLADVGLSLPDFRSAERTFQLLTQVAGRAGRGERPGRVMVQTFSPEHPSIVCARDHDYLRFYEHEKAAREEFFYPPYSRLINIIIRARDEKKAYLFARTVRDAVRSGLGLPANGPAKDAQAEIIGPSPLPFYRLRGHFRWHVMVKCGGDGAPAASILRILSALKKPSAVAYVLDVDPLNIL